MIVSVMIMMTMMTMMMKWLCKAYVNHQPDFIYLAALRLDKMTMTYK